MKTSVGIVMRQPHPEALRFSTLVLAVHRDHLGQPRSKSLLLTLGNLWKLLTEFKSSLCHTTESTELQPAVHKEGLLEVIQEA